MIGKHPKHILLQLVIINILTKLNHLTKAISNTMCNRYHLVVDHYMVNSYIMDLKLEVGWI